MHFSLHKLGDGIFKMWRRISVHLNISPLPAHVSAEDSSRSFRDIR